MLSKKKVLHYRGSRSPFLHFVETDVIQENYADLTLAISTGVGVFGNFLVQYNCAAPIAVTNLNSMGISDYQKAGKLLSIIDARIKTSASKQAARDVFDCLVRILAYKLHDRKLAQALIDTCRSRDHYYVSPLLSGDPHGCESGVQETGKHEDASLVAPVPATPDSDKPPFPFPTTTKKTKVHSGAGAMQDSQNTSGTGAMQVTSNPEDHNHKGVVHIGTSGAINHSVATRGTSDSNSHSEASAMEVTSPSDVEKDSTAMQQRVESDKSSQMEVSMSPSSTASQAENDSERKIAFSKFMSEENFIEYLKSEGLCDRDSQIILSEGFTAMSFVYDFTEQDIDCAELGFTRGGKRVLKRLLKEVRQ